MSLAPASSKSELLQGFLQNVSPVCFQLYDAMSRVTPAKDAKVTRRVNKWVKTLEARASRYRTKLLRVAKDLRAQPGNQHTKQHTDSPEFDLFSNENSFKPRGDNFVRRLRSHLEDKRELVDSDDLALGIFLGKINRPGLLASIKDYQDCSDEYEDFDDAPADLRRWIYDHDAFKSLQGKASELLMEKFPEVWEAFIMQQNEASRRAFLNSFLKQLFVYINEKWIINFFLCGYFPCQDLSAYYCVINQDSRFEMFLIPREPKKHCDPKPILVRISVGIESNTTQLVATTDVPVPPGKVFFTRLAILGEKRKRDEQNDQDESFLNVNKSLSFSFSTSETLKPAFQGVIHEWKTCDVFRDALNANRECRDSEVLPPVLMSLCLEYAQVDFCHHRFVQIEHDQGSYLMYNLCSDV